MSAQTSAQAASQALRKGLLVWLALSAGATALGYVMLSTAGLWGALLGAVLAGVFFSVTAIVAVKTSNMDVQYLGFAVLGSWLLKILLLIGALAWLRTQDFYSRPAFFLTLLVQTFALLIVEARILTRAPVPYVEPDR